MKPDVHYVRNGGVALSYQVIGDGPVDLFVAIGYLSNLEYASDTGGQRSLGGTADISLKPTQATAATGSAKERPVGSAVPHASAPYR